MMKKRIIHYSVILLVIISCTRGLEAKELRFSVSYLAAAVIYLDGGREQYLRTGDTLKIFHDGAEIGSVVITAVSRRSSAAQVLQQKTAFVVGDSAVIMKDIAVPEPARTSAEVVDSAGTSSKKALPSVQQPARPTENIVSGRAAIQYNGIIAEDSRFNLQQPSALLRLDVQNLYGSGMVLTVYGRSSYDTKNSVRQFGSSTGLKNRVYEISLQRDVPESPLGYGAGRMTSRYVGGMGTFDGFQVFYRYDRFTAGVLGGAQVVERSLSFNSSSTKGSLFLNYRSGQDFFHQYDGTIAYGRQMVSSSLDREFLYLQNSLSLGPELSFYESTEIELNDISNGKRSGAFKLSNTFLSVNYYPTRWFSANLGYDAARSVYLFETMKSFSDTLFDKNLLQGYRGSVTVRLPYYISLSANATYRTKKGDARDSYNLGSTFRISDILGSEVNSSLRYSRIVGVFSDGNNITADIDRTLFSNISTSLRYDYYKYTISSLHQTYTTHTISANVYYRISRMLYSTLAIDDVIDATLNSYRVYAEVGVRF
jgi:hypothetical protein